MKILDIIKENDELINEAGEGLKPEERLGSRIARWFKSKQQDPNAFADTEIPSDAYGTDPGPLAQHQATVNTEKSKRDSAKKVAAAKAVASSDDAGIRSAPATDFDGVAPTKLVAKPDKEATLDNTPKPASIVARDKWAGRDTNRGLDVGRGRDMTRADAVAQADAKFTQNTPAVAKTSKYPKGDIRNLGKYIKPANVTSQNQGGKKMAGDVEPQKKGTDLRNLLKLAGVNRPDGSAKDNK